MNYLQVCSTKNMKTKKFEISIIIILFLVGVCYYLFFYEPEYNGPIKPVDKTLVFSHRGLGDYAPDNSLIGAEIAMKDGFAGVDMDAQLTKDGEIVIFHDLSVDRLTEDTGKVKDKTKDEMLALDLAKKFKSEDDRKIGNAPVATFEDFVKNISPNGILMVELKVPGMENTGIEQKAINIIAKYNAWDKVYLSSFNPIVLYRLKHIDPRIKTVYIFMDTNWNSQLLSEIAPGDLVNLPWFVRTEWVRKLIRKIIKPDLLSVNNEVDEKVIDELLSKGDLIFLWTIDGEDRMNWAINKKPYGIISDEPYKVRNMLKQN